MIFILRKTKRSQKSKRITIRKDVLPRKRTTKRFRQKKK